MTISKDKNYLYIVIVYAVFTLLYLSSEYIVSSHQMGVPLDDTWIHYRFAENFAKGYFFQYNINEPTPGTTSPLWVIILSIPFLVSKSLIMPYSLFLTSIFFLLTCVGTYRLSLRLGFEKKYSFLITVITLLNGRMLWSSLTGMEITLCTLLCVLVFLNHVKEIESGKIRIVTGLLLGLSVVTRPECYLLAALYYVVTVLLFRTQMKGNVGRLLLSFILFVLIIIPYPIFCYVYTGSFLPNTFKGQSAGFRLIPEWLYIQETARLFIKDNLIVFILWLASTIYFIRSLIKRNSGKKFLLLNLWIFLLPVATVFIAPIYRHYGRYLIPLIPFINIVAINILQMFFIFLRGKNKISYRRYPAILTYLLILFSFAGASYYGFKIGWNIENINDQQVNIAHWVNINLPLEKTIAVNDIGALTYLTGKRIVDMEGLITPEILQIRDMPLEDRAVNVMKELKKNNVNYLIIYPGWYENIMEKYSPAFEQLYSARLSFNTICGDVEMFVFRIHWEKINLNQ